MHMPLKFLSLPAWVIILLAISSCTKDKFELTNDIGSVTMYKEQEIAPGIVYGSVYYSGSFNAFTDLAYFNKQWVVIFREGTDHLGATPGRIKTLVSNDGKMWRVEKVWQQDSVDLRDPKLMVDPDKEHLYATFFGRSQKKSQSRILKNYYVNYTTSAAADSIGEIEEEWPGRNEYVLWRWTAWKGSAYSIAYRISTYQDSTTNLCLMQAASGFKKLNLIKQLNLKWQPTETTIRFDENDKMYVTIRADASSFYIGTATPPYNEFKWLSNNGLPRLASPNFIFYKPYMLITGRDLTDNKFRLFAYNLTTEKIEKDITFPGGFEVGYGGMEYNPAKKNEVWISYYSIEHGGHGSNIYLIKMDIEKFFK